MSELALTLLLLLPGSSWAGKAAPATAAPQRPEPSQTRAAAQGAPQLSVGAAPPSRTLGTTPARPATPSLKEK